MSIPIGADHFTRDVARLFKVNYDFAESLKRQFGSAVAESAPENTLVELPSADGRGVREASGRHLNEILEARAEQIFERVYEEVSAPGCGTEPARRRCHHGWRRPPAGHVRRG